MLKISTDFQMIRRRRSILVVLCSLLLVGRAGLRIDANGATLLHQTQG